MSGNKTPTGTPPPGAQQLRMIAPKVAELTKIEFDALAVSRDPTEYVALEVIADLAAGVADNGAVMLQATIVVPPGSFAEAKSIIALPPQVVAQRFMQSLDLVSLPVVRLLVRRRALGRLLTEEIPGEAPDLISGLGVDRPRVTLPGK